MNTENLERLLEFLKPYIFRTRSQCASTSAIGHKDDAYGTGCA